MNQSELQNIFSKNFILIVFANFFMFLGFQMTLPTLPLFINYLNGNEQLIGIVVGIFTFASLLIRPIAGHSLDSIGRKKIYLFGVIIFIFSVSIIGYLQGIFLLLVLRVVQGVGWAFSTTASGTIATDIIPPARRGEGMGYFGLSGNLALAIGPTLGLTLVDKLEFTTFFLICGLCGLIAFFLSTQIKYKENVQKRVKTKKLDIYEKSAIKPSILIFFITFTFGAIASFLPLFTQSKGIDGIEWYFIFYAIFLIISRILSGKAYDNYGHKVVFIPGVTLIFIAMILLSWIPNTLVLLIAASIYGTGFGLVQPALQAWSVKDTQIHRRGMANATFFSFFDLGIGIGSILFGQIAFYYSYELIYITAALSVFICFLVYINFLLKDKKKATAN